MVIDIANMLKDIDVPVQTIDFGHPNFRDGKLVKIMKVNQLLEERTSSLNFC